MSDLGKTIRRAAFAAATTMAGIMVPTAPAAAQAVITIQPNNTDNAQAALIRQYAALIRLSLLAVGKQLAEEEKKPGSTRKAMEETVTILQESLNVYRGLRPGFFLPTIKVDGKLGPDTANLAIRIAAIEKMEPVFLTGTPGVDPEDAGAYATLRDRLATLSPVTYAGEMRQIVGFQISTIQRMARFNVEALSLAFRECANDDERPYDRETLESEMKKITGSPGYITPLAPPRCIGILERLAPPQRVGVQRSFITTRPVLPENQQGWCRMREGRTCLEAKI